MTERVPFRVQPMLATLVREPFHRPGWVYEEKYDGYRIVACKEGDRVRLFSRNAKDRTATFPAVAEAVASLDARTLVLAAKWFPSIAAMSLVFNFCRT